MNTPTETESPVRSNLIFFASADPLVNPSPVINACHFVATARKAGLVAELRLAGDAVRALDESLFLQSVDNARLREGLQKVKASQARVTL